MVAQSQRNRSWSGRVLHILAGAVSMAGQAASLARSRATAPGSPCVGYLPHVGKNPYQQLLYSAWAARVLPLSPTRALVLRRCGLLDWLHIHWDEYVFPVDDPELSARTRRRLEAFRRHGGRIIWTLHNAEPHDLPAGDGAAFAENRQRLIDLADVVHVHSHHAAAHLRDAYRIDDRRIVVSPHPTYHGAYPPAPSQPAPGPAPEAATPRAPAPAPQAPTARAPRRTLLVFGIMRDNKAVASLLIAVAGSEQLRSELGLHLAGLGSRELADGAADIEHLHVTDGFVPGTELAGLFAGADAAAFPLERQLTSGSLMLAFTFGVPPIFPKRPQFLEVAGDTLASLAYDPADPADLTRVLEQLCTMPQKALAQLRAECSARAETFRPDIVSRALFAQLSGRLCPAPV